ncbi:PLDc N-terminal domain-containing protein [Peloplasma aerotolerans]|uniref:PLDc N-terminal domain-containing protein n=1 Tax=Peloplasma aerotolerans TaxID=3044389 RepID=A0AAW6U952_9MOLU|nr:PLDc N-terminal domain-containing protein [Mariniplasma sp. M4Ah]MDI6453260.1 PLDc N-terminal domain-containing protein [Mariniplasma sp. M4Ah]
MEKFIELLPLIIPLLLVQVVLVVYALLVLKKTKRVRGESRLLWILIIVFLNLAGPIIFLIYGRLDDDSSSDDE